MPQGGGCPRHNQCDRSHLFPPDRWRHLLDWAAPWFPVTCLVLLLTVAARVAAGTKAQCDNVTRPL